LPGADAPVPLPNPTHSGLPSAHGQEELPTFGDADPRKSAPNALGEAVEPLVALLRDNTWIAFAVVLAALAVGLGGIALLLNLITG
jgi:hypothetical protein